MAQGRGSAAATRDPAMGPRAAGGAGAPSSRTPPHPAPTHEAAPWTSTRALLSLRSSGTSTALMTAGGGTCLGAVCPSRDGPSAVPPRTR